MKYNSSSILLRSACCTKLKSDKWMLSWVYFWWRIIIINCLLRHRHLPSETLYINSNASARAHTQTQRHRSKSLNSYCRDWKMRWRKNCKVQKRPSNWFQRSVIQMSCVFYLKLLPYEQHFIMLARVVISAHGSITYALCGYFANLELRLMHFIHTTKHKTLVKFTFC